MSETNSAVLELNDDCDEADSVPPSKPIAGAESGAPLIMEEGYDIAVRVDNPLKQLSTLETFVTYRVRCVCARWPSPPFVRRRYNHFKVFHKRLSSAHPLLTIPPLPPHHSALEQLDRYEQNFVALRTMALHVFMERIAKHPILTHSEELRLFVTTSECEADREFRSESALWGLPGFASRDSRTAGAQRVKDPEFSGALDYLNSLQQKLTTLNSLTNKLNRGTNAVGTEMAGLSTACGKWSGVGAAPALSRSAAASAAARSITPAPTPELPFLAAYAAALAEKIVQRNNIHATHISDNSSEDIHNKLLQASESLRSDLQDWTPKTRNDIKNILTNMADKQINIHTQTLQAWELALKQATLKKHEELFKTVSKTAVQNLSPTKSKKIEAIDSHTEGIDKHTEGIDSHTEGIDNHTEQDIEEFDIDSEIQDLSLNDVGFQETDKVLNMVFKKDSFETSTQVEIHNYEENCGKINSDVNFNNGGVKPVDDRDVIVSDRDVNVNDRDVYVNDVYESINDVHNDAIPDNDDSKSINDCAQSLKTTINNNNSNLIKPSDNFVSKSDIVASKSDIVASKSDNVVSKSDIKPEMSEKDAKALENIFENQFLDINSELSEKDLSVQSNLDSASKDISAKLELKGVNATTDPLTEFTDIDLNNT